MNFSYTGSGNINITGCTQIGFRKRYHFAFAIGSKVYSVEKAQRGILEFVYIKNVLLRRNKYRQRVVLYVDTLNWIWNENDLCDHQSALTLAINYLENLQQVGQDAVKIICNSQNCLSARPNDEDEDDAVIVG